MSAIALYGAAADAVDGILASVFQIQKAKKSKPSPLAPAGFDAYVLELVSGIAQKADPAEAAAIKDFLDVLHCQWGGLSKAERTKKIAEAKQTYLDGVLEVIPQVVIGQLKKTGEELAPRAKADSAKQHGLRIDPSLSLIDEEALDHMAKSQALYVTNHLGERAEKMSEQARAIVANGLKKGYSDKDIAALLDAEIPAKNLGRSRSYYEMVSSVFVARSRTYSVLSGFHEAGISAYQWETVLDELTCNACRFMHGRIFRTAPAMKSYHDVAEAENPEAVKAIQPWLFTGKDEDGKQGIFYKIGDKKQLVAHVEESAYGKKDEVGKFGAHLSSAQLQDRGIAQPPAHGRCRCTLVPVWGNDEEERTPEPPPPAAPPQARPLKAPPAMINAQPASLPANIAELVRPLPKVRDYETSGRPALAGWLKKLEQYPGVPGWPDHYIKSPLTAMPEDVYGGPIAPPYDKPHPATIKAAKKKPTQAIPFDQIIDAANTKPVASKKVVAGILAGNEKSIALWKPSTPTLVKKDGKYYAIDGVGLNTQAILTQIKGGTTLDAHIIDLDAKALTDAKKKPKKPKAPTAATPLVQASPPLPPMPVAPPPKPLPKIVLKPVPEEGEGYNILNEKVGEQRGSNEGGFYLGEDGVKRYVKKYVDPARVYSEHLANQIYRDLGHEAPESQIFTDENGKLAYSSKIFEGGQTLQQLGQMAGIDKEKAKKFMQGFVADVLTGNWDAVGTGHDNAMLLPNGNIARIDNGGTFLFRAQQVIDPRTGKDTARKPKSTLNDISEWDVFFSAKNPYYRSVADKAGYSSPEDFKDTIREGVAQITALRKEAGSWRQYVDRMLGPAKGLSPIDREEIVEMLETRTKLLEARVAEWDRPPIPPPPPGVARYVAKQVSTVGPRAGLKMEDLPEATTLLKDERYNVISSMKSGDPAPHKLPSGESYKEYIARAKKATENISPASRSAIGNFTGSGYDAVRESQVTGRPNAQAKAIQEAFKVATPEPGTVFRGIANLHKDVVERYLNGPERFKLGYDKSARKEGDGTASASWNIGVSIDDFMGGGGTSDGYADDRYKILFKMNGKTQIPVEHLSGIGRERELFLRHDSVWKITGLSRMPGTKRVLIVEAEEE